MTPATLTRWAVILQAAGQTALAAALLKEARETTR